MPLQHARSFVEKTKEQPAFRDKVMQTKGTGDLAALLSGEGLHFDQRELIGAWPNAWLRWSRIRTADLNKIARPP